MTRKRKTHISGDDLWVLDKLQSIGYTSAIIAGGAVRDAYFKIRIRDIDIFYYHPKHSSEKVMPLKSPEHCAQVFDLDTTHSSRHNALHPSSDYVRLIYSADMFPSRKSSYDAGTEVQAVIEMWKNMQLYQFIGVTVPPTQYVKEFFDTDICRCWCDGTRMRYSGPFLKDAKNKTITVNGNISRGNYKRVMKEHVPRLQRKFRNFTVVDLLKKKYD